VLQLEAEAARTLGKEAGLFLSSGTQGTQRLSIYLLIYLFVYLLLNVWPFANYTARACRQPDRVPGPLQARR